MTATHNPEGTLDEKCAWMKARHTEGGRGTKARSGARPKLHSTRKGPATINLAALKVLSAEGERYAYVLIRRKKLILLPLPMEDDLVAVAKICPRPKGCGAHITIPRSVLSLLGMGPGETLIGRWEDSEGYMVFEKSFAVAQSQPDEEAGPNDARTQEVGL